MEDREILLVLTLLAVLILPMPFASRSFDGLGLEGLGSACGGGCADSGGFAGAFGGIVSSGCGGSSSSNCGSGGGGSCGGGCGGASGVGGQSSSSCGSGSGSCSSGVVAAGGCGGVGSSGCGVQVSRGSVGGCQPGSNSGCSSAATGCGPPLSEGSFESERNEFSESVTACSSFRGVLEVGYFDDMTNNELVSGREFSLANAISLGPCGGQGCACPDGCATQLCEGTLNCGFGGGKCPGSNCDCGIRCKSFPGCNGTTSPCGCGGGGKGCVCLRCNHNAAFPCMVLPGPSVRIRGYVYSHIATYGANRLLRGVKIDLYERVGGAWVARGTRYSREQCGCARHGASCACTQGTHCADDCGFFDFGTFNLNGAASSDFRFTVSLIGRDGGGTDRIEVRDASAGNNLVTRDLDHTYVACETANQEHIIDNTMGHVYDGANVYFHCWREFIYFRGEFAHMQNKVTAYIFAHATHCHGYDLEYQTAADCLDQDVVMHEYAHSIMYQLYGGQFPNGYPNKPPLCGCAPCACDYHACLNACGDSCDPGTECNPPNGPCSCTACSCAAIIEGWAKFGPCLVKNDPSYRSWNLGNNYLGEKNEFGFASILWDIYQADGANRIWAVFRDSHPATVKAFYDSYVGGSTARKTAQCRIFADHGIKWYCKEDNIDCSCTSDGVSHCDSCCTNLKECGGAGCTGNGCRCLRNKVECGCGGDNCNWPTPNCPKKCPKAPGWPCGPAPVDLTCHCGGAGCNLNVCKDCTNAPEFPCLGTDVDKCICNGFGCVGACPDRTRCKAAVLPPWQPCDGSIPCDCGGDGCVGVCPDICPNSATWPCGGTVDDPCFCAGVGLNCPCQPQKDCKAFPNPGNWLPCGGSELTKCQCNGNGCNCLELYVCPLAPWIPCGGTKTLTCNCGGLGCSCASGTYCKSYVGTHKPCGGTASCNCSWPNCGCRPYCKSFPTKECSGTGLICTCGGSLCSCRSCSKPAGSWICTGASRRPCQGPCGADCQCPPSEFVCNRVTIYYWPCNGATTEDPCDCGWPGCPCGSETDCINGVDDYRPCGGARCTGVGGVVVPVDKFGLLAPYIGSASVILVCAVATAIYVKRIKHRKEKR